jgi:tetratricopeptide (TPR) repeat protein
MHRYSITVVLCAAQLAAQSTGSADGGELLRSGRLTEARDAFERVLSIDAGNGPAQAGEVDASERIALQEAGTGNKDEALKALERARNYAPHNARLLYDLGVLEDQMSLYRDADEALAEAEKLDNKDPKLLYAVARVKMDLGQLGPAEEKMKAYLEARPDDASAHFGLGRIYQIGLRFDQAKAEFARSIELKPVQTEGYYELGDIALKQGDAPGALANFEKTLARDPRHGGALEGAGEAHFKLKQYEEARSLLERAIEAAPDYPPSHYYLGLTLARLGKKEEAQRELAKASELSEKQNASGGLRLQKPADPQ